LNWIVSAGRATTNDELENMLESGNPAIFTQGVSSNSITSFCRYCHWFLLSCAADGNRYIENKLQK